VVAKASQPHTCSTAEESPLGVVAMNVKQAEQIQRALGPLAKQNMAVAGAFQPPTKKATSRVFIQDLKTCRVDER